MAERNDQIDKMNDNDEQYRLSEIEQKSFTDVHTSTNDSAMGAPVVDYNRIIETFRKMSNDKKDEYIDIYIEMSWKSPLLYVTQDQHIEIFERIGVPLTQLTCKQDEKLCFGAADEEVTNKTKEIDLKIAATTKQDIPIEQRIDNFDCLHGNTPNETTSNHKQKAKEKPMLPPNMNSRLASRRCTTYFDKKGPLAKMKK